MSNKASHVTLANNDVVSDIGTTFDIFTYMTFIFHVHVVITSMYELQFSLLKLFYFLYIQSDNSHNDEGLTILFISHE